MIEEELATLKVIRRGEVLGDGNVFRYRGANVTGMVKELIAKKLARYYPWEPVTLTKDGVRVLQDNLKGE